MVSYAPMLLLFGTFAPHVVASVLMFRVWGFVNHANVRVSFGPLTPLIAGPQWHRIHHSIRPEHRDTNFAALFPFIDRLFRTYYHPAADEYPPTGLSSHRETWMRDATISPFAAWNAAAGRFLRRLRDRVSGPPDSQAAL
jgi:sterol desaturase/sphingolipid hydroxylase (fatty acid hydroxylase superfamily)